MMEELMVELLVLGAEWMVDHWIPVLDSGGFGAH